jgi:hypothetical protein
MIFLVNKNFTLRIIHFLSNLCAVSVIFVDLGKDCGSATAICRSGCHGLCARYISLGLESFLLNFSSYDKMLIVPLRLV